MKATSRPDESHEYELVILSVLAAQHYKSDLFFILCSFFSYYTVSSTVPLLFWVCLTSHLSITLLRTRQTLTSSRDFSPTSHIFSNKTEHSLWEVGICFPFVCVNCPRPGLHSMWRNEYTHAHNHKSGRYVEKWRFPLFFQIAAASWNVMWTKTGARRTR